MDSKMKDIAETENDLRIMQYRITNKVCPLTRMKCGNDCQSFFGGEIHTFENGLTTISAKPRCMSPVVTGRISINQF